MQLLVSNILSTLCCQPCLEWLRHTTLTIQQFKNSVRFWSNYLEWQVVETKTIEHKDMSGNTLDKTHPSRSSDDCSEITTRDKNIGEHHAISENTFCSICHQHFTDLFRHSKRSHPMVELECAYCELKFESKAAIRKHFKVDHRQMNRLTCDICHKSNLSKWVKMIFFFWESSFISNRLCFPFQTVLRTPSRVPQSLAGQSARL